MAECVGCRACEATCPSGVPYGTLLERSRAQIETARQAGEVARRPILPRVLRLAAFAGLFRSLFLLRLVAWVLWLYQRSGLRRLLRRSGLLRALHLDEAEGLLPDIAPPFLVPAGQRLPAEGPPRRTVALFAGCVMSTAFAEVQAAAIRVLRRSGCTVVVPRGQGCCGALHVHGGDLARGRALLRRNIRAFAEADAIVVTAAGCGSVLKEAGDLLAGDPGIAGPARDFAARVRDIHELLSDVGLPAGLAAVPRQVTYQDPCHLAHAQHISAAPRQLLRALPGLTLHEMAEAALCCGSAGVYNLTRPDMARRLGERKIECALRTGAQVIATANPGCALQLRAALSRRGAAVPVRFVVELIDEALM
jgi:glycolate oxidase iron-sulfur subunit